MSNIYVKFAEFSQTLPNLVFYKIKNPRLGATLGRAAGNPLAPTPILAPARPQGVRKVAAWRANGWRCSYLRGSWGKRALSCVIVRS